MGMDTVTIVVNELPVVSVLTDQLACVGSNTQLIASPEDGVGGSGEWSGQFVDANGVFNPDQAGEFMVKGKNKFCSSMCRPTRSHSCVVRVTYEGVVVSVGNCMGGASAFNQGGSDCILGNSTKRKDRLK